MRSQPPAGEPPAAEASDRALLEALREGDSDAYAALWERHYPAAVRAAKQYDHSTEAEDIAQEAFARVLDAVRQGNGPQESFRAYLLRSVSNVAQNAARSRRRAMVSDDEAVLDSPVLYDDPAVAELEQHFISQAYLRLTRPQREVLWYVEVEQLPTKQAATYLGMAENTAAKTAGRAREALKREYLQVHVEQRGDTPECGSALERMGRYVRGSLSATQRRQVDRHVEECARCALALAELNEIGRGLQVTIAPLVIGTVPAAAGYLAATTGDKTIAAVIGTGATTGAGTGAGGSAAGGSTAGGASNAGGPPRGNSVGRVVAIAAAVAMVVGGIAMASVVTSGGGDPVGRPPADAGGGAGGGGAGGGGGGSGGGGGAGGSSGSGSGRDSGGSGGSDGTGTDAGGSQPDQSAPGSNDGQPPDEPPSDAPPQDTSPTPEPTRPTRSPEPPPEPSPTPTSRTPSPDPPPEPPSPEPPQPPSPAPPGPPGPTVSARQLTGPNWESEAGVAYAAIAGERIEPGSEVTLTVRNSLLSSVSEPTGTVGSGPPLEDDGTWDCTGVGQVGYTCSTVAGESGSVIAAVSASSSEIPFVSGNQLTVQLSTEAGSSSDRISME